MVSSAFTDSDISIEDVQNIYEYSRHDIERPKYFGKVTWKPETDKILIDACGEGGYIFGFSLWTFLRCPWDEFHDQDGSLIRNIGRDNEYIIISDKGIFIFTINAFHSEKFWRCMTEFNHLFKFKEYDQEEKSCSFEPVARYFKTDYKYEGSSDLTQTVIDFNAPCPEEVMKTFNFITEYYDKSFFGKDEELSAPILDLVANNLGYTLDRCRSLQTFHYRVLDKLGDGLDDDHKEFKIVKVDAYWLEMHDTDSNTKHALYIKDFPGFDINNLNERRYVLWEYTNLRGYCCGNYDDFFIVRYNE